MIVITPSATVSAQKELYSTQSHIQAVKGYQTPPTICNDECNQIELPVFADPTVTSDRINDKFNFTFNANSSSYVVAVMTFNGVDYTITDQTYADYNPIGTIANSLTTFGLILDFKKIANVLGYGSVVLTMTIYQNVTDRELKVITSPCFRLMKYDCELAHGTVKVRTVQKGYFRNGVDWSLLTGTAYINHEIRIYGRLTRTGRTSENEVVVDNQYKDRQITSGIYDNFSLSLKWINFFVSEVILKQFMLNSPVLISDFNIDNITIYDDKELKFLSSEDPSEAKDSKQEFFTIKLEDYQKDNQKRY